MLLEHFRKKKHHFFYYSKGVGDALMALKYFAKIYSDESSIASSNFHCEDKSMYGRPDSIGFLSGTIGSCWNTTTTRIGFHNGLSWLEQISLILLLVRRNLVFPANRREIHPLFSFRNESFVSEPPLSAAIDLSPLASAPLPREDESGESGGVQEVHPESHRHSSDKSVAGGGVIIGGLATAVFRHALLLHSGHP
ncbi:hypothetical protein OSB04_014215 [Centaurea solstitialis]|uniref:Uncharacterized protein n=1 Tax=Centaurea solstitialis TaxID=347529 RepID=A0AA38SWP1_9ASTR|nr:hypothetical protein OSB04_014215 [Centaurea solstitialis]